jgi:hypothetical protein
MNRPGSLGTDDGVNVVASYLRCKAATSGRGSAATMRTVEDNVLRTPRAGATTGRGFTGSNPISRGCIGCITFADFPDACRRRRCIGRMLRWGGLRVLEKTVPVYILSASTKVFARDSTLKRDGRCR